MKAGDRQLGFGFCLLGAKGELAEPAVCLHCSFLTPLGPSACSCSSAGGGETGRKEGRHLQCLRRLDSLKDSGE